MPVLDKLLERASNAESKSVQKAAHVAAVCYRVRQDQIEFLLVQSRSGRWTFPKGKVGQDRTRADAAAREAYEEAGVRGRVEAHPFSSYVHKKRSLLPASACEHPVDAHLCEVQKLQAPLESFRNPTWFSPEASKRRLLKKRSDRHARELARVVDEAKAVISQRHLIRTRTR